MEEVNKKWFVDHGFSIESYDEGENGITKIICTLSERGPMGSRKFARWDYNASKETNDEYYEFYARGDDFTVECRLSEVPFTVEQIVNALKTVGFSNIIK